MNKKQLAIPLDAGVDARSVFDSATAQVIRTPADKQLMLHVRALREQLEDGLIDVFYWIDTEDMLPDGMTKGSIDRRPLLALGKDGVWSIRNDNPVHKVLKAEPDESHRGSSNAPGPSRPAVKFEEERSELSGRSDTP